MTWSRFSLALLALFWGVMNFLLWRAEYGDERKPGGVAPAEMVWQKVLTAPDNSILEVYRGNAKAGYFRWSPNVGQERSTGKTAGEDDVPEGWVQQPSGYTIDL